MPGDHCGLALRRPVAPLSVSQWIFAVHLASDQCEVVTLVASGVGAKQMARQLSLWVLTANDHLKSIYRKADVRGRDELISRLS